VIRATASGIFVLHRIGSPRINLCQHVSLANKLIDLHTAFLVSYKKYIYKKKATGLHPWRGVQAVFNGHIVLIRQEY
jgi:hypothetical protein